MRSSDAHIYPLLALKEAMSTSSSLLPGPVHTNSLDRDEAFRRLERIKVLSKSTKDRRLGASRTVLEHVCFGRILPISMSIPSEDQLVRLVHYFFPSRARLPVEVCDFGPGRAQHTVVELAYVDRCES